MILCAGLGTRLRPWTLEHPKALVPVAGMPMLERVIRKLEADGFDRIVINVHHFAEQIREFIPSVNFSGRIDISDETDALLETGGAILHAAPLLFSEDSAPVLIYNVDIISNADTANLMAEHEKLQSDSTLLVSNRDSSRKLLWDDNMHLRGWHNILSGEILPEGVSCKELQALAFSGIYVVSSSLIETMQRAHMPDRFPIVPFLIDNINNIDIYGVRDDSLSILDIGKPGTLDLANALLANNP